MQDSEPIDVKQIIDELVADQPALPAARLHRYVEELLRWNPRIGLISKQTTATVIPRLIRQSIRLWDLVVPRTEASCGRPLHVVDVGSGGGFPGIVWALLEPEWEFLLVERRHKKAAFLERMATVLELGDVEVFAGDAQEAGTITRFVRRFDASTAMAVGPPAKTAGLVEPFLRPGRIFATTVPRDEPDPPARVGGSLILLETDSDSEAVYAIYQKG